MKLTNTLLSLLRHAITIVGGALAVSPEPQSKAIGIALAALGAAWGSYDEHKAENPGGGLNVPPAAMLMLCALLGASFSFGVTGCATAPTPKQNQITAAVLNLAGTSVAPVLKNNPAYIPVAQAVLSGLTTVQDGKLDASTISSWVATIAQRQGWDAGQTVYAQTFTTSMWSLFTSYTGQTSAQINDSNVQLWLTAFENGLANAIAIAQVR